MALRLGGFTPLTARTAGEGLRLLPSVELAIVDLNLSGLPGDEVCRAIREVRGIPVILTSGAPSSEGRALARSCGAAHFLRKPFPLEELLQVVGTLVAEAASARQADGPGSDRHDR